MGEREERQQDDLLRNPTEEELAQMTPEERHADFERRNQAWRERFDEAMEPLRALAEGRDPYEELKARAEQAEAERDAAIADRDAAAEARDEYLDDLKRLAADFDNYRKRAARDQENTVLRAGERVIKELLPILDDLGRTFEAASLIEDAGDFLAGMEMVRRQLDTLLEKEGVKEIDTQGRFDPHIHEAIGALPASVEEGTVIEVVQRGYMISDRVLRPARVVIASAPVGEESKEG